MTTQEVVVCVLAIIFVQIESHYGLEQGLYSIRPGIFRIREKADGRDSHAVSYAYRRYSRLSPLILSSSLRK